LTALIRYPSNERVATKKANGSADDAPGRVRVDALSAEASGLVESDPPLQPASIAIGASAEAKRTALAWPFTFAIAFPIGFLRFMFVTFFPLPSTAAVCAETRVTSRRAQALTFAVTRSAPRRLVCEGVEERGAPM
jgi:hypothetical protein